MDYECIPLKQLKFDSWPQLLKILILYSLLIQHKLHYAAFNSRPDGLALDPNHSVASAWTTNRICSCDCRYFSFSSAWWVISRGFEPCVTGILFTQRGWKATHAVETLRFYVKNKKQTRDLTFAEHVNTKAFIWFAAGGCGASLLHCDLWSLTSSASRRQKTFWGPNHKSVQGGRPGVTNVSSTVTDTSYKTAAVEQRRVVYVVVCVSELHCFCCSFLAVSVLLSVCRCTIYYASFILTIKKHFSHLYDILCSFILCGMKIQRNICGSFQRDSSLQTKIMIYHNTVT